MEPTSSTGQKAFPDPFDFDNLCGFETNAPSDMLDFEQFTSRPTNNSRDPHYFTQINAENVFATPRSSSQGTAPKPTTPRPQTKSTAAAAAAAQPFSATNRRQSSSCGVPVPSSDHVLVGRVKKTKANERPHTAVEIRYRARLNEKYATLAKLLSQPAVLEICRTETPDWTVRLEDSSLISKHGKGWPRRQSKTITLSLAVTTSEMLERCCSRKGRETHALRTQVQGIRKQIEHLSR